MKKAYHLIILLVILQIFGSCNFEDDNQLATDLSPDIRVTNDYLHFKNPVLYKETLDHLNELDHEAKLAWLADFKGYESYYDFKTKIMNAEHEFGKKLDKMSESELQILIDRYEQGEQIHSPLVNENREYLTFFGENDFDFKIGIPRYYFPLVNKEGIVKVGEHLIKYTDKFQYTILDGDESKLYGIESLTSTSEELGIEVVEIGNVPIPADMIYDPTSVSGKVLNCTGPISPFNYVLTGGLIGCGKNGNFRVRGFAHLFVIIGGRCDNTGRTAREIALRVENQRFHGIGSSGFWLYNDTYQLSITLGSFQVNSPSYPEGVLTPLVASLDWPGVPFAPPSPVTLTVPHHVSWASFTVWRTECIYIGTDFDITNLTIALSGIFRGQNFTEFNTAFAPCDC